MLLNHHSIIYKEMEEVNSILDASKLYYPFRITHWNDASRCKLTFFFMSVKDKARYQPGDNVGTIRNDRVHHGALNIDGDFQVRQNISLANTVLDQHTTTQLVVDSFRQQFDSLPKDFLSKEQLHIDPLNGSFFQSMQFRGSIEQKWWQLFSKYWLIKNQFNDNDCKKMNWLMTGGNHATVDTSGENFTMHCDSIYYNYQQDLPSIDRLKYVGCGHLINSCSIDTPAQLLKLELGAQLPIKSLPKLKRDIVQSLKRQSFCGQLNSHCSKYWQGRSIMPHHHDESIAYTLPNSRSSFFDNSVVQKFEAVSEVHSHYHTTDYICDTYEHKMMQHSGECMSFCVGGPRYFEAPTIVETFDQWSS